MSDKLQAATHGCRGECCRNPYGTCFHGRKCEHHKSRDAIEVRRELELQHIRDMERAAHLAVKAQRRQW